MSFESLIFPSLGLKEENKTNESRHEVSNAAQRVGETRVPPEQEEHADCHLRELAVKLASPGGRNIRKADTEHCHLGRDENTR